MLTPATFDPIPELRLKDGRLRLLVLANFDLYYEAVDDPWFAARDQFSGSLDESGGQKADGMYYSRQVIEVVACSSQRFVCFHPPNESAEMRCEAMPYFAHFELFEDYVQHATRDMSSEQASILRRLYYAAAHSDMTTPLADRGPAALLASQNSFGGIGSTSNNALKGQWIRELQNLFASGLLAFQTMSAGYVSDPYDLFPSKAPASAEDAWMCSNQIVISNTSASFSVVGLSLIFGLGILVLLIAFLSENIAWACAGRKSKPWHFMSEWNALGFLQLQRFAYGARGLGVWSGDDQVPIELEGQTCVVPRRRLPDNEMAGLQSTDETKQFSEDTSEQLVEQLVAIDGHQHTPDESEGLGSEACRTTSHTSHDYFNLEFVSDFADASDLVDAVYIRAYHRP